MGRASPKGAMSGRVGNYRADVDTTNIDPEMTKLFKGGDEANPGGQLMGSQGSGILNAARGMLGKMKTGFGRLVGNRPTTEAEEQHYKNVGQQAFYNAKRTKDLQR